MATGKRVKQFKAFIPQPDLSHEEAIVHVYFEARDGVFRIDLPAHIAPVVQPDQSWLEKPHETKGCKLYGGSLRGEAMAPVIAGFEAAMHRFRHVLREGSKTRVIRMRFSANIRGEREGQSYINRQDISLATTPALAFTYEVLWEAGGRLYEQRRPDDPLRDVGVAKPDARDKMVIIPWSEHAEAFMESIHTGLTALAFRLIDFEATLRAEPTAIETMRAGLFLPAPTDED